MVVMDLRRASFLGYIYGAMGLDIYAAPASRWPCLIFAYYRRSCDVDERRLMMP